MDTTPPAAPEPTPPTPPNPASPVPTPPSGSDEKQWKVILHLSGLLGFVGPLVVWLVKKEQYPSIDAEGRKVLNFQFSYLIYMIATSVVGGILSFLCVPLILPFAAFIAWLVFTIIGAVKASNNESYEFPLTIKML
jgi:uncharacterized Tic20 family protein